MDFLSNNQNYTVTVYYSTYMCKASFYHQISIRFSESFFIRGMLGRPLF